MQLQGFPIYAHTFASVKRRIIHVCYTIYLLQDTDLPLEGEPTVGMVLAGDSSQDSSRKKHTLYGSKISTSASKESSETSESTKYSTNGSSKQQAIPARTSPVGDTGSSARAQQDEGKAQEIHSAHSLKVQPSYPPSTGELPKQAQKNEHHLEEGRVKTVPITTVTPLETPPLSSLSQVESPKHSLHETVAALHQKSMVEPDSPLHENEIKTESSRGISKSGLTSSSSEIFHSFSGDEGVEPFPALSSPFASSKLTMPYFSEWKHSSLASPLTATLTTGGSEGGGGGDGRSSGSGRTISPQITSFLSSNINTAKVCMCLLSFMGSLSNIWNEPMLACLFCLHPLIVNFIFT